MPSYLMFVSNPLNCTEPTFPIVKLYLQKATETHASKKSGQYKVKKDRNGMKAKQKHKEM